MTEQSDSIKWHCERCWAGASARFKVLTASPLKGGKLEISWRTILAAPSCDPSLGPPLAVRADHRHDVVLQVDTVEAGHPRVRPGATVADERVQRGVAELWVIESI